MNSIAASLLRTAMVLLFIVTLASCVSAPSSQESEVKLDRPSAVGLSKKQIELAGFTESNVNSRDLAGYRPLKRVLVTLADEKQLTILRELAPEIQFVGSAGVVIGSKPAGKFDAVILVCAYPGVLEFAEEVAWVHSYSAGVEDCLAHPTLKTRSPGEQDYIITNSSGTAASIIGEHAIAMMMSFSRGLHHFRDAQSEAKWSRSLVDESSVTTTIGGKTMLVLGLGSIGKEVARRGNALGMRVLATRNSSREGPDYVDYVGLSEETLALAGEADVIVNALPLTGSTRNLVNKEFFDAMKSTALLVSVGRGGTTNTDDLVVALQEGRIAGAALDVTDPEPLPTDHPLWKQKNVIITPHLAGTGGDARSRVYGLLIENIRRYQAGDPLINQVSRKAGY